MMLGLGLSICNVRGGAAFLPTNISGLLADYDVAAGATVGGGFLTALADQSGTGDANKALAKAGAGNITYNTTDAAYNNAPTASFPGTNSLVAAGAWSSAPAQPYTIYAEGQSTSGPLVSGHFPTGRSDLLNFADDWNLYAGQFLAATSDPTQPVALCGVFNGTSSALYVTDFVTAAVSGDGGAGAIDRLTIGEWEGAANYLTGKVARVLIYSGAHSAPNRALVRAYLTSKYGAL